MDDKMRGSNKNITVDNIIDLIIDENEELTKADLLKEDPKESDEYIAKAMIKDKYKKVMVDFNNPYKKD
jgi:hypothetical protein